MPMAATIKKQEQTITGLRAKVARLKGEVLLFPSSSECISTKCAYAALPFNAPCDILGLRDQQACEAILPVYIMTV